MIRSRLNSPVVIEQHVANVRLKLLNRLNRKLAVMPSPLFQKIVMRNFRGKLPEQKPDLIISFGGNVLALNVALGKLWECNNIAIGNLYSIDRKHLSANITMFNFAGEAKVIPSRIALSKIDPQVCAVKGRELKQNLPESKYWGMLIGGNGAGYRYQTVDWHQIGAGMKTLSEHFGIKWIMTTSRRSGKKAENILMQYLTPSVCAKACLSSQPKKGSIEAILGACDQIFCTEDSMRW